MVFFVLFLFYVFLSSVLSITNDDCMHNIQKSVCRGRIFPVTGVAFALNLRNNVFGHFLQQDT